ncbi:hypothetical protein NEDG_00876 [Nematocida displodere]|uniref:Ras modification protein ERF4 n=1 Tax=Nematocida displodere TaxID=1805483 RepID=A0A177ECR1_9MICR|nr:hypothetical protein NEDG_00876 [Nematocida displodere]
MSIVYVPAVPKNGELSLEETLPSVLEGKVPAEEWAAVIHRLNAYLRQRKQTRPTKLLASLLLTNFFTNWRHARIDQEIERYLERKNMAMADYGIYFYHPKDRVYDGLDVEINLQLISL